VVAELIKVANCDKPGRLADLVFVHGLDGDARQTWHPKDKPAAFWPAWLGEDFPELGIWSLDYDVSSSAWKGHSMPLVDRATNVMDLLELDDIGQRPVAFICHSLGGLLIKQVLRLASDSRKPRLHAIAAHTQLMVFLSTPHSGADMANWIDYIGKLLRATVSVEELQAHHPRLLELNKWYRDHVSELGVETFVYCEKLPTAGVLVVNQTTADPGIPGVDVVPLDEDHISICKLTEKNQVYRRVQRLLKDHVMAASTPPVQGITATPASGPLKIQLCDRLLSDWQKLADYFDISSADRARFERGREPHEVWEWLQSHGRFGELKEGLSYIGRPDLVELLTGHPL
jgi:hypothetical protein